MYLPFLDIRRLKMLGICDQSLYNFQNNWCETWKYGLLGEALLPETERLFSGEEAWTIPDMLPLEADPGVDWGLFNQLAADRQVGQAGCASLYPETIVRVARERSLSVHGTRLFNMLPKSLRNENYGDFLLFKNHLDIFLAQIPDQPTTPGLVRAADTNSLLDQIPLI